MGQQEIADLLADFFDPEAPITVRAASERIEKAIREAKETLPMELNADKVVSFAGKVANASNAIAGNDELSKAYSALAGTVLNVLGYNLTVDDNGNLMVVPVE